MNYQKYIGILVIVGYTILVTACGFGGSSSAPSKGADSGKSNTQEATTKNGDSSASQNQVALSSKDKAIVSQGIIAYQNGNYAEAMNLLNSALQQNPANYAALSAKGMTLALQGQMEDGLKYMQDAYNINSDYAPIYYDMAIAYKLEGRLGDSQKWFAKVIEKDPKNTWALYGIATIYADTGERSKALEYLRQAILTDSSVKATARTQDHFAAFHGDEEFEKLTR